MSERAEDGMEGTQVAQRDRARALAIEACATWVDQWEDWEGSVITGFVLLMEVTRPGRAPLFVWATGDGVTPDQDERGGLPSHRGRGLATEFLAELNGREVELQRRRMEQDGE